jgi:hypothetical protein
VGTDILVDEERPTWVDEKYYGGFSIATEHQTRRLAWA